LGAVVQVVFSAIGYCTSRLTVEGTLHTNPPAR
jgi:hypothetical protein